MGLSLNPVDVWKLFADHKKKDKEQIALWLEQTADEARKIAEIWIKNRDSARARESIGTVHSPGRESNISNVAPFSRLENSYDNFSSVMDGRVSSEFHDDFSNKAASVIIRRNEVKDLYDRLFGRSAPLMFFDSKNNEQQLNKLDSAIDLLDREAAALEVLARNFRASK